MPDTNPALSMHDLSYAYMRDHCLLESISFGVHAGEVLCIAGRSGAGKSTLLRLIAGLERPHAGSIELAGRCLVSDSVFVPAERRSIGVVFQDYQLFPHLTSQQNVAFGMRRLSGTSKAKQAMQLLDRLGIADRALAMPHELSGGEQQRVAVARALAIEPQALLLDEPCRSLDKATADSALELIRSIVQERNIPAIMVSHDAGMASQISKRCIELSGSTSTSITVQVSSASSPQLTRDADGIRA